MIPAPWETGWTLRQRALVEDRSRKWRRQRFQPSDAVEYRLDGKRIDTRARADAPAGGTLVPDAWDHEHCALCWGTISPHTGDGHEGYTDGADWLCVECFARYVAPQHPE